MGEYLVFKGQTLLVDTEDFLEALKILRRENGTRVIRASDSMILADVHQISTYHNRMVHVRNFLQSDLTVTQYIRKNKVARAFKEWLNEALIPEGERQSKVVDPDLRGMVRATKSPRREAYSRLVRGLSSRLKWLDLAITAKVGSASNRRTKETPRLSKKRLPASKFDL